jgi:hypothetical protein
MKKILVFLSVAFLLFCAALVVASYKADALIASVKPQLEKTLSDTLGTKVTFGQIKAKVFPETVFVLESLSIGEPSTASVITLNRATLLASLLPLLKGEIVIHELSLKEPKLTITNGTKPSQAPAPQAAPSSPSASSKTTAAAPIPITLNLERLSVEQGNVSIETSPLPLTISNINFSAAAAIAADVSTLSNVRLYADVLNTPMKVSAEQIALDMAKKEITPTKLAVGILDGSIDIQGVLREILNKKSKDDFTIDITTLSIEKLLTLVKQITPALSALNIPGTIKASIRKDGSTALINEFIAELFGGSLSVKGDLTLNGYAPLSLTAKEVLVKTISIEQFMKGVAPTLPLTLFGTITSVNGSIATKLSDPMQTATGAFNVAINDGGVKGINIIGASLRKLLTIPVIGDSLSASMHPSVKTLLDSSDTSFSSLQGVVRIKGTTTTLSNMVLTADTYEIQVAGTYDLSGAMKLETTATLKPALASLLVASAKDIQKALNPDGSLSIPVKIEGTLPSVSITPDIQKIMQSAAGNAIKDAAKKALEKGLGKNGGALKGLTNLF